MSLLLVEHEPEALADTRFGAVDRQSWDLEAHAEVLERQAADLRQSAERLSERARRLRAIARQLGGLNHNAPRLDHFAGTRVATDMPQGALPALTPRQREIVRLIACGRTNRQIAQELVVTVGTAANHVAQILDRLGLENRVQLAAWAVEHRDFWLDRTRAK